MRNIRNANIGTPLRKSILKISTFLDIPLRSLREREREREREEKPEEKFHDCQLHTRPRATTFSRKGGKKFALVAL